MRILTLGSDICRFLQAVVNWNNIHKTHITVFFFILLLWLLCLLLAWLVCLFECIYAFISSAFSSKLVGCYLLHCSWLCFTFMLFISLFSFLLALVILLFFLPFVLPKFSHFCCCFGPLIHYVQIV